MKPGTNTAYLNYASKRTWNSSNNRQNKRKLMQINIHLKLN